MINKKAQVEKALTFPVFLIVLVIMAGFIILASAISLKAPNIAEAAATAPAVSNLFLQSIKVELNGAEKSMLVYDALNLKVQGKIKDEQLVSGFKSLLNEKNNCYLLVDVLFAEGVSGAATTEWGFKLLSNGEFYPINDYKKYEGKLSFVNVKNFGIERSYKYYYGRCLDE